MIFRPYSPRGPFSVGIRDFAFCCGKALLPDQHCCGRIFYPSAKRRKTRFLGLIVNACLWLPHYCYAIGYTKFLFFFVRTDTRWRIWLARIGVQSILTIMGMLCCISGTYNAPIVSQGEVPVRLSAYRDRGEGKGKEGKEAILTGAKICEQGRHPVIFFSHGLAGTRNTYSSICTELASAGFIVVAVEHADGTASTARLAFGLCSPCRDGARWTEQHEHQQPLIKGQVYSGSEWLFYNGLGDEKAQVDKTRYRVQELRTARRLIEAMDAGKDVHGLWISGADMSDSAKQRGGTVSNKISFKACVNQLPGSVHKGKGRVDLSRVAVAGHSYGGATAVLAASEHYPEFKAAVAMDPWWGALPPDCLILNGASQSQAPLLILGSHAWNTPNLINGKLACNGERQEALLAAAAGQVSVGGKQAMNKEGLKHQGGAAAGQSNPEAPGALLVVCRDSNHHSYDDVLLYFGRLMSPLLKLFNFESKLHPLKSLKQVCSCTAHFLSTHLALSAPCALAAASAAQASSSSAPTAWIPLEAPVPLRSTHAEAYRALCPGDELHILRACTVDGVSS